MSDSQFIEKLKTFLTESQHEVKFLKAQADKNRARIRELERKVIILKCALVDENPAFKDIQTP